jgi:hypothetical protein
VIPTCECRSVLLTSASGSPGREHEGRRQVPQVANPDEGHPASADSSWNRRSTYPGRSVVPFSRLKTSPQSSYPSAHSSASNTSKAQAGGEKAYRKASRPFHKKKRFILLALIALIIIIVVISTRSGGSGSSSSSTSGGSSAWGAASAKAAGLTTPVRDGKFEFTVTGQDCAQNSVGTAGVGTKAQGVFCIVSLSVKNIGNQAQTLIASSQYAFNASGQKYSTDDSAEIYLDSSNTWVNQINPGNTVQGKLVYDVPVGTKLTKSELHDSAFSGGVDVNVG